MLIGMGTAEVVTEDTQWDVHTENHWQMQTNQLEKVEECDFWLVTKYCLILKMIQNSVIKFEHVSLGRLKKLVLHTARYKP